MENGARPAAGAHWLAAAPPNFRARVVGNITKNLAQVVQGHQLHDRAAQYEAMVFSRSDNVQDYLREISNKMLSLQQKWQPSEQAASELRQQAQIERHQMQPVVDAVQATHQVQSLHTRVNQAQPAELSPTARVAQLHPHHPTVVTQIQNLCPARQNSTQQPQPRMDQHDLRVDQRQQIYQTNNGQHADAAIMQTRQHGVQNNQQLGSPHPAGEVDWREDMFQKITSLKDAHLSELVEFARALQAYLLRIEANGQLESLPEELARQCRSVHSTIGRIKSVMSFLRIQKTTIPEVAKDQLDMLQTAIHDLVRSYRELKARNTAKKNTGRQSQNCPEPPQAVNMSGATDDSHQNHHEQHAVEALSQSSPQAVNMSGATDDSHQNHHEQHAVEALSQSSENLPSGTPLAQQQNHSDHFAGEAEDNSMRDEAESPVAVDLPGDTTPFTGRTYSQKIQQRHPEDEVTPLSTESVEPAGASPAQQQTHSANSVRVEAEDDSVQVEAERPVSMEVLIKRGVDAARSLSPAALRSLASDMGVNLKRAFRRTATSNTMDGSSCVWFDDESSGESFYKRQKTHDCALLDEIRATYNMLVETEIRISQDDTGGAGGTVIELSYNAVSLAPDLKAAICPSGVSTKLLAPADYPHSSPVILGVEEQTKGVQRVVDMAFRRGDLLPEPRSIEGMAKAWDSITRRAIVRFAHQFGGGTFSTRYGQWESCVPA